MANLKLGHYIDKNYIDVFLTKCWRLYFCYTVGGDMDSSRLRNRLKSVIFFLGWEVYVGGASGSL